MTDLSPRELEVLMDTEFLRTKAQVTGKIVDLLGKVEEDLMSFVQGSSFSFPQGVFDFTGKISRGDKYRGLPYLVLDFPRKFEVKSTFAFRTIFLWGDSFSNTLHLSGNDLDSFRAAIKKNTQILIDHDFWVCINQNQWEHHFGSDNYLPMTDIGEKTWADLIEHQPFVKLARRIELDRWKDLRSFSTSTFDLVLKCLAH